MRFLLTIARKYPGQSIFMVGALLLVGILEGMGISMFLPLLTIAVGNQPGGGGISAAKSSKLEHLVSEAFAAVGLKPSIEILLVIIIAIIVVKSAVTLMANKRIGYTIARIATDLRLALLRALLVTRWEYYLDQPIGKLTNSMATEASRASSAYSNGVVMLAELFQSIVLTGVALLVSWRATLIALAVGCIIIYLLRRFVRKARKAGNRQTTILKSLLALMTDMLQSIKPLKAMAREGLVDFMLEKKTTTLNKALQKQVFNSQVMKSAQEPMLAVFLAVGIYAVLVYWRLPLTTVMVLVFLLARLIKQLNKVQERYQQMVIAESAYWSIQDTTQKIKQMREPPMGGRTPCLKDAIRLDKVSFAYSDQWVLRNASLVFPAGKVTAIIGPSGAGKTTVVDLVTGLLRPQEGEVWIDDLPLVEADIRSWRRMIGYIPQETLLLHDTVLNNVNLGDRELTEADAEYALRAAGGWEFVKSMPQGIHGMVGERGGKLSGGQRQRIAIARALVHKPKLLILDEATTSLDPKTEAAICGTLQQLSGRITILAISHQPALLSIADQAYRIQDGEIMKIEATAENNLKFQTASASGKVN
jgi:ATP-binding cassette subfamily C protein